MTSKKPNSKRPSAKPKSPPDAVHAAWEDARLSLVTLAREVAPELASRLERLSVDPSRWARELDGFVSAARLTRGRDREVRDRLVAVLSEVTGSLDGLVASNRDVNAETTTLQRYLHAAGVGERVSSLGWATPQALTQENLAGAVARRLLTPEHARKLGLSGAFHELFDGREELVERAAKVGLEGLLALDAAGWTRLVGDPVVGAELRERLDVFAGPTRAFAARLRPLSSSSLRVALTKAEPVLRAHPHLGTAHAQGVEAEALAQLRQLDRRYPGLELGAVLVDTREKSEVRAREVERRIEAVHGFLGAELMQTNLAVGSSALAKLFGTDTPSADQRRYLKVLQSYQRAWALARSSEGMLELLDAGITSASALASRPWEAVEAELGKKARALYEQARRTLGTSALSAAAMLDHWKSVWRSWNVANASSEVDAMLQGLDGFAAFFGSQAFCDCKHCQSVLSPAAYFVDLLQFVEENVRQVSFASRPNHPLDLKTRRPDLWSLPLTCENTNTLVPTLDVANPILEDVIARRTGFAGSFSDRSAVERHVHETVLPGLQDALSQPASLPLERVEALLEAAGTSRAKVAAAWGLGGVGLAAARFGLSQGELQLVTQPNVSPTFLARMFGAPLTMSGAVFAPLDAQLLLPRAGLSRGELSSLISTRFVNSGLPTSVRIVGARRSSASIQNDVEHVVGLTPAALDRLHRFARLQRKVGVSIEELDLALTQLNAPLDQPTLVLLGGVFDLRRQLGLSLEDTLCLFSALPTVGLPNRASSFDRAFNAPTHLPPGARWPVAGLLFLHPALRLPGSTTAPDASLSRLLTGLRVTDETLLGLITALQSALGMGTEHATEAGRSFELNAANLSLLYRHARLGELLGLTSANLRTLLQLVPGLAQQWVVSVTDLERVVDFHAWWRASAFSLSELAFVTRVTTVLPEGLAPASELAERIAAVARGALVFADTVFAAELGLTEEASRLIVQANASRLERLDEGWRLKAGFDPNLPLALPTGVGAGEQSVRDVLLRRHVREVLPRALGACLGFEPAKSLSLVKLSGQSFAGAAIDLAVRGGSRTALVTMIEQVLPLAVALKSPVFDARALDFLRARPAAFGISDVLALTSSHLRELSVAQRVFGREHSSVDDAAQATSQDLATALTNWSVAGGFSAAAEGALARLLHTTVANVAGARTRVPIAATASLTLSRLVEVVALGKEKGWPLESFAQLASQLPADHARVADSLRAALLATTSDEKARSALLEPIDDRLRSRRRDALCDALLFSLQPTLKDRDELYAYYLIDVQLEGCARTSRVVSAISSVQLYVSRVLMRLEVDDLPPLSPNHVACALSADARAEWTWRKSFRVWEANRKVFLFPENYVEPSLRDDKTELFKELEASLRQQEITEQTVIDAYAKYLRGFHELASLTVAGAYQDPADDVLHLFGATSEDPPTYYYRTAENLESAREDEQRGITWTPWRKLQLQISSRRVAPVVANGRLQVFWPSYKTQSVNSLIDGDSRFTGYLHQMSVRSTSLRLDGTWSPPQELELPAFDFVFHNRGKVVDNLTGGVPRYDSRYHGAPVDDYTLTGPTWAELFAEPRNGGVSLAGRNFLMLLDVDLFTRKSKSVWPLARYSRNKSLFSAKNDRSLWRSKPTNWYLHESAFAGLTLEERRLQSALADFGQPNIDRMKQGLYTQQVATLPLNATLTVVAGNPSNIVVQSGGDLIFLQGPGNEAGAVARRIGTTLADTLHRTLFTSGLDGLLNTMNQIMLSEAPLPLTLKGSFIEDLTRDGIDFTGAYGTHFREIFFHIPALIADTLNAQGRFEAAQQWYHRVFDPSGHPVLWTLSLPPMPADGNDRAWRYLEFRNLGVPRLRELLTDPAALEVYRKDPFNPHAIARLRLSAYQKNVVMRYVDNLLDWADSLFTQFTTESLNEATLLYVLAGQILGARPAELGSCEEAAPRTFADIAPLLGPDSEILAELETWVYGVRLDERRPVRLGLADGAYTLASDELWAIKEASRRRNEMRARAHDAAQSKPVPESARVTHQQHGAAGPANEPGPGRFASDVWSQASTGVWSSPQAFSRKGESVHRGLSRSLAGANAVLGRVAAAWHSSVIRQVSAQFCVPANQELLALWSRLEQRLFNLRHCRDINGVRRLPALFAPELDPRLMIKAKAAGLTIDEVMQLSSGALPPYRFPFLIEKARVFAQTAQSFGAALLGAIERKDADELNRLRLVQQQHVAQLSTQLRRWEIDVANESLEATRRQREAAEYRRDRQAELMAEDLTPWERTQQIARHASSVLHGTGATLGILGGILGLIPDVGSPFAMKYGGVALSGSADKFASAMIMLAGMSDTLAASAGLEAGFARRRRDWATSRELADREVKTLERQERAAALRVEIAQRSLELHQKSLEQLDEMFEHFSSRFTNAELFTWLASTLGRVHREAWTNALAMTSLAEQAYEFERAESPPPLVGAGAWDAGRAGLLAGEQLVVDLQTLERRYLETNGRTLEIDQSLSLVTLDPEALLRLRETGECEFEVPEVAFDLAYPGHYRRRIKAVRVTVPCVTGPYTNVSATLTLTGSAIRKEPRLGAAFLVEEPVRRTVSIATSSAQNDAGVFDLSFRDERYMPFEGAGVVSRWKLTLPKSFRQFDYSTISDVILSMSYLALEDGALRTAVETLNATTEGTILHALATDGGARLVSLRSDFSSMFNRLLNSPLGSAVTFELSARTFPAFLRGRGRTITVEGVRLAVRAKDQTPPGALALRVDGVVVTNFVVDPALGGMLAADAPASLRQTFFGQHSVAIENAGAFAPPPGSTAALDEGLVLDVFLSVAFKVT